MRLCFFVNDRKARGRNVAGGSDIGSIVGFNGIVDKIGCAGVPKAGEEEGTESFGKGDIADLNIEAAPLEFVVVLLFIVDLHLEHEVCKMLAIRDYTLRTAIRVYALNA